MSDGALQRNFKQGQERGAPASSQQERPLSATVKTGTPAPDGGGCIECEAKAIAKGTIQTARDLVKEAGKNGRPPLSQAVEWSAQMGTAFRSRVLLVTKPGAPLAEQVQLKTKGQAWPPTLEATVMHCDIAPSPGYTAQDVLEGWGFAAGAASPIAGPAVSGSVSPTGAVLCTGLAIGPGGPAASFTKGEVAVPRPPGWDAEREAYKAQANEIAAQIQAREDMARNERDRMNPANWVNNRFVPPKR